MSTLLIYEVATGQQKAIDRQLWEAWQAVNNPKAVGWFVCPAVPELQPGESVRWDELARAWVIVPPPPRVYPAAERYQVLEWLIRNGIAEAQIEGIISTAVTDPIERQVALMRWRTVTRVPRDHPLVTAVASLLGIDLDAHWETILSY